MPTFEEIVRDSQQYPDNTPITIGDTQVPLGSLRSLTASERNTLQDRMKAVEEKETALNGRQRDILDLAQKAQAAYAAAEEARKTATAPAMALGADPFSDPWLSPVKAALADRDKQISELQAQLKQTLTTVGNAAAIWADDRWEREYGSLDFGKREKKPSRDEILNFAKENKIVDRHGMPSVRGAWEKMSEADRMAESAERARQEGIEEGRRMSLAARIPPPGVPGSAPIQSAQRTTGGDLGDIFGEVMKDPELRSLVEQLPAGMA